MERRFDQPALSRLTTLENTLSTDEVSDDAREILAIYDDIDTDKFVLERRMSLNLFSGFNSQSTEVVPHPMPMTVYEWANYFAAEQSTVRQLFSETIKVIQMLLAVPASAASAERSFSCLRRLKTWLRRTMTQKRLTHLALLHCHRQRQFLHPMVIFKGKRIKP